MLARRRQKLTRARRERAGLDGRGRAARIDFCLSLISAEEHARRRWRQLGCCRWLSTELDISYLAQQLAASAIPCGGIRYRHHAFSAFCLLNRLATSRLDCLAGGTVADVAAASAAPAGGADVLRI